MGNTGKGRLSGERMSGEVGKIVGWNIFFQDDITWCSSDCNNTDCYRHPSNMVDKEGLHSFADFKGTDVCPMRRNNHAIDSRGTIIKRFT